MIKNLISHDFQEIHNLWIKAFSDLCFISISSLEERLVYKSVAGFFVADRLVGFIAYQMEDEDGSIMVIAVDPAYQKQGIGIQLLQYAEDDLQKQSAKIISVGSGAGAYFWPGVPMNLEPARRFFLSHGYDCYKQSFDLVQDISSYLSPAQNPEVLFDLADINTVDEVVNFETKYFPLWTNYFRKEAEAKRFQNILIAKSKVGKILGSVLLFGPGKHLWSHKLGYKTGGFGALGVAKHAREKGIGLALANQATFILKKRGVINSFVGWTLLADWYGKLGYKIFQSYAMARKYVVENLPRSRFGNDDEMAGRMGELIRSGVKTATCSAYNKADTANEVGDKWVVEDSRGVPLCVVETIDVSIVPFDEVDPQFAFDEGEDDRTLTFWRAEYKAFFERNGGFTPNMLLICERFKVLQNL